MSQYHWRDKGKRIYEFTNRRQITYIFDLFLFRWYHGSITRIEAETTLRPLSEGSFLVRNCESTKQDYSLSLK